MALDVAERDALLRRAVYVRDRVAPEAGGDAVQALRMSPFALTFLKRHSVNELETLLAARHASDVSQRHWRTFAPVLADELKDMRGTTEDNPHLYESALYMVGWLCRLARMPRTLSVSGSDGRAVRTQSRSWVGPASARPAEPDPPEAPPSRTLEEALDRAGLLPQADAPGSHATRFNIGDKVEGKVMNPNGVVQLVDGSVVRGVAALYGTAAGDKCRFVVVAVGGDGKVKQLRRR